MSHYQTLGVDKTATQAEIKKSYRKLSMQHHPDKGGNEDKFKDYFRFDIKTTYKINKENVTMK